MPSFPINRTNEMNAIQQTPWGTIVPWVERAGELVGVVYHLADNRLYIAIVRNGTFVLLLNGREKTFPERTSMTRWVKMHLV